MNIVTIPNNRSDRALLAEDRVTELNQLADHLLEEAGNVDHETAESLRWEASRLSSVAFEVTRALCHDNIELAYAISVGDDVGGTSLGLIA